MQPIDSYKVQYLLLLNIDNCDREQVNKLKFSLKVHFFKNI